MRLVTFNAGQGPRVGVQMGDLQNAPVADVSAVDPSIPSNMRCLLEAGPEILKRCQEAADMAARMNCLVTKFELMSPILNPEKVICIGMNYADHCHEQNFPIPETPIVFNKFSSAVCGPYSNVEFDGRLTKQMDFEVELAVVIGKAGKNIPRDRAMEHVAGYTVAHDVSARDWQLKLNGSQWLLGKTFDTFCPLGPALVTKDSMDPHKAGIRCRLNGEIVQDSNTEQLIFKTEYVVEWLSRFFVLRPGDVILTGTPPGVGCFRKPQLWLKHGDLVECEIDGIGTVRNRIVDTGAQRL